MEQLQNHPLREELIIIFFTAMENMQCIQKAYQMGANAYLFKPTKFEENVLVLKQLLQFYLQAIPE